MPFTIIRNDITKVRADAIVNTANRRPAFGRGTDQAIYSAAGREKLLAARKQIGEMKRGEAVVTEGFDLPAKYIIHTVGPRWEGGKQREFDTLASCYRKSLQLAKVLKCESIAFPLISAGTHGFPKDKALEVALREIRSFLQDNDMDVSLVVFDRGTFELSRDLAGEVDRFIDERLGSRPKYSLRVGGSFYKRPVKEDASSNETPYPEEEERIEAAKESVPVYDERPIGSAGLDQIMKEIGETFQQRLLKLIDERGMTDTEVYKKANLDRKLFSKIRCNPAYRPKKKTVLALAIALELDMNETTDLLARAEHAFSPSNKFDLIIEYCIQTKIYDIFEINAILFDHELPLLA